MKTLEQRFRQAESESHKIYTGNAGIKDRKGLLGVFLALVTFLCIVTFFSATSQAGLNRVIVCKTMADVNKLVDLQVKDKKAATAFAYKLGRQSRCALMRIMFPATDYVDSLEYYRKDGNTIYGTANVTLKSGGKVYALIVAHIDVAEPRKVGV